VELNRRVLLASFVSLLANSKVLEAQELSSALLTSRQARLETGTVGEHRVYFEGSTEGLKSLIVGSLVLKPSQQPHPPHTHADEEIIALFEGTGEISMNGKPSEVGPGDVMYAAPYCLHGIRNTGPTLLMLYYFKWITRLSA
jgi:quercetin dioxygenase-like cupin family protein